MTPDTTVRPTPACAHFEPLLPLLGTDALSADEMSATNQHIAGCAWCQAQRTGYATFEAALHRHYSASTPSAAELLQSPLTLDDILYADGTATPAMDLSDAVAEDTYHTDGEDREDDELTISPIVPARPPARAVHPSRRWKPIHLAEIAAVLIVALLATTLLLGRLGSAGTQPTQPPLKSAAGAVVFTHSVLWGKLTINGKSTQIAFDGNNPLYLPAGRNTLVYTAPPLPAIRCTISAPAAKNDTCPLYTGDRTSSPDQQYNGRIVDLEMTPDRLSQAQRNALAATVQQALNANPVTIQVLPGDHYAAPNGTALTASQAFPMTLAFQVAANGFGPDIAECAPFCGTITSSWSVQPTMNWSYPYQQGQLVTPHEGWSAHVAIDIRVQWDGAWKVSLDSSFADNAACQVTTSEIPSLLVPNVSWGYGCPAADAVKHGMTYLAINFTRSDPGSSNEVANILYRAGVWIALDSNAHYLFPSLPAASAHELSAARSLGYTH